MIEKFTKSFLFDMEVRFSSLGFYCCERHMTKETVLREKTLIGASLHFRGFVHYHRGRWHTSLHGAAKKLEVVNLDPLAVAGICPTGHRPQSPPPQ